jgi:hypothetical protein
VARDERRRQSGSPRVHLGGASAFAYSDAGQIPPWTRINSSATLQVIK